MTRDERVQVVRNAEPVELACVFGGHLVEPYGFFVEDRKVWVHTEVDGHPVCTDHILLITNERTVRGVPEGEIKKALVRNDERNKRARLEQSLRRGTSEPGWVYYARIGELIKIGFTLDLPRRIASYPPNTVLLAAHPGTRELEGQMHKRFAELRARGREWFRSGRVLEGHITDVVHRFGDPAGIVKPMRHTKTGDAKTFASSVLI